MLPWAFERRRDDPFASSYSLYWSARHARTFDVSDGLAVSGVPRCVLAFDALTTLDVSRNGDRVRRLPDALGCSLRALEVLRAHSCRLRSLPTSVRHCRRLRVLDVADNCIGAVPLEYDALVELERVNVAGNRLGALDADLLGAWHRRLVELDATRNAALLVVDASKLAERRRDDDSNATTTRLVLDAHVTVRTTPVDCANNAQRQRVHFIR